MQNADDDVKQIKKLLALHIAPDRCDSCGKSQREVRTLIALKQKEPRFLICNECVELCAEICQNPKAYNPPPPPKNPSKVV